MARVTAIFIDEVIQARIEANRKDRYETANDILRRMLNDNEPPVLATEEMNQPDDPLVKREGRRRAR